MSGVSESAEHSSTYLPTKRNGGPSLRCGKVDNRRRREAAQTLFRAGTG